MSDSQEFEWKEAMLGQIRTIFGDSTWHSFVRIPERWACIACQETCPATEQLRGLINVLGTVYDVPLCQRHYKQYHGTMMEDLPFSEDTVEIRIDGYSCADPFDV